MAFKGRRTYGFNARGSRAHQVRAATKKSGGSRPSPVRAAKKKSAPRARKEKAAKPPKSKTRAKIERKLESKAESLVLRTLRRQAGTRAATIGAALTLPVGKAAAALGAGGTALAVGAAFAVGYGIGKGLLALVKYLSPAERQFRKARAFREARVQFELEQGRKPTASEVKEIQRGVGFGIEGKPPSGSFRPGSPLAKLTG